MAAKGFSFKDLSERNVDLADFEWDDEDENKKPKKNPFDYGESDFSFDSSPFESSKREIKEFLNTSRGISYDDNDDSLGEPWGGAQYSLKTEKPQEVPKSARFRSESFEKRSTSAAKSLSVPAQKATVSASGKTPPARPSNSPSQIKNRNSSSAQNAVSSSSVITSTNSSQKVSSEKTGVSNNTKKALNTASLSISEVISNAPQVSANEYSRLQSEVGQLRRDLQAAKQSRLKPLPVEESVKRIMRGQPYSLELHKSLQDKVNLLNCAVKHHDGNAIIAVILFLKRTVKHAIFTRELLKNPKAVNHYCKYLQQHYQYEELAQFNRILGKQEDAAMVKFKQALKVSDPSLRLHSLKDVYRNDVSLYQGIPSDISTAILDYTKLLEMQISVEQSDSRAEQEKRNMTMNVHPRKASIPLQPVITTLFYCCMYHYAEPEVSDKQFEWTAILACAKVRRWKEIDEILKGKGWFGSSKNRSLIGFDRVSTILFHSRAPEEVVAKYLRLVDDPSKRLSIATKCKSYDVVIETLVLMKDRQKLDQFREQLPNHAPQHQTINNYLRNSQIRWKN